MQKFIEFQTVSNPDDLYFMLANGDMGIDEVRQFSQEGEKRNLFSYLSRPFIKTKPVNNKSLSETIVEKLKEKPESLLLGDDITQIKYDTGPLLQPDPRG